MRFLLLGMAGVLDYSPALNGNNALTGVDDTSSTLVGTLNGKIKVYVDPYSANVADKHFYVAGCVCRVLPFMTQWSVLGCSLRSSSAEPSAINPNTFPNKIGQDSFTEWFLNPFAQGLATTR